MEGLKRVVRNILPFLLGGIYTPLLVISITNILGTTKGNSYTIAEPELSSYKTFGYELLLFLIILGGIVEFIIKRKFYDGQSKLFVINMITTIVVIILLWPIFYA